MTRTTEVGARTGCLEVQQSGLLESRQRAQSARAPRRRVTWAFVMVGGDTTRHRVTVTDVSERGAHFRTAVRCPVRAHITLHLPSSNGICPVEGEIRYACQVRDETGVRFGYGVRFHRPWREEQA